jgi:hypothetical protein
MPSTKHMPVSKPNLRLVCFHLTAGFRLFDILCLERMPCYPPASCPGSCVTIYLASKRITSHVSVFASIHDATKAIAREILQRTSDLETCDLAHHNSWLSKEGREFELWEHDGTSLTGRIAGFKHGSTPGSCRIWVSGHLDRCAEEFWDIPRVGMVKICRRVAPIP